MRSFCFIFGAACLLLLTFQVAQGEAATDPVLTRDEVKEVQGDWKDEWESRLPRSGSVLFLDVDDWSVLKQRIASDVRMRELSEKMLKVADEIVATPIPVYEPPQDKVTPEQPLRYTLQELWERRVGDSLVTLALAAKLTDSEKYRDKLHDMVIAACGYETWGRAFPGIDANMDLAAGSVIRGVAMAWDWHRDAFSPEEQAYIVDVVRSRGNSLLSGLYGKAYWASRFTENHNHVSVAGLGLAGLSFYRDIPEAGEWLAGALLNFQRAFELASPDGSSDEGVPYWTYGLTSILQFVEGTKKITDADEFYDTSTYLRNGAEYRIAMSTPAFGSIVPWGDAPYRDHYGPQHLLYRLASQYRDFEAQYVANHIPFEPRGGKDIMTWVVLWYDPSIKERKPEVLDYHAEDWDVATTRDGWEGESYMLSLKSGFTNRTHSHLDAGALAVCVGDEWLLTTPGYGSGDGQPGYWDESGPRWTFFSNATESHSTLLIDGQNQRYTPEARATIQAFYSTSDYCWIDADLSEAYSDGRDVRRSVLHRRGDYILVLDNIHAEKPVKAEWLAQAGASAVATGSKLSITGNSGQLDIVMLDADETGFVLRAHDSKKINVPSSRLTTYATAKTGSDLSFDTLLQARPTGQIMVAPIEATLRRISDSSRQILLSGSGWSDVVTISTSPLPASASESDVRSAIDSETVSITSERTVNGQIASVFAVGVTAIDAGPMSIASPVPFCLSATKVDDGWDIQFATDFSGRLIFPESDSLVDSNRIPVSPSMDGKVSLRAGGYRLRCMGTVDCE
jgi:hypothetical protein